MRLPDLVAYQAAVQNPSTAFADTSLRGATVATGRLGLPRAVTGNFAVTYQLRSGSQQWAVRCFHREAADRASRYAAISQALARLPAGPLVPIEYLGAGVRVGQAWYPITKMPWVEGRPLNVAVEANLGRPAELTKLERGLLEVLADLRRNGIAHGDLQHGNILVDASGRLRLVDYDGMFVPALHGRGASESGDPNYQHPRRSGQFDEKLDSFSAIVIVLALRALSIQPALWRTYNTGDNLLFRRSDFADPPHSALFRELSAIDAVRELVDRFARVCLDEYLRVPAPDDFLRPPRIAPVSVARGPTRRRSWKLRRTRPQKAIAVSPDGALVATASIDGAITLRESARGRTRRTQRLPPFSGALEAVAFTASGDLLAASRDGSTIRAWHLADPRASRPLACAARALGVSVGAEWLVAATPDGMLRCWRLATGRLAAAFKVDRRVVALAVSADGRIVATGDTRGHVGIWRARDGQPVMMLDVERALSSLAFSADGARLGVGATTGEVLVLDVATGALAWPIAYLDGGAVESLALSADGAWFAATTRTGAVCLRLLRGKPPSPPGRASPDLVSRWSGASLWSWVCSRPWRLWSA